MVRKVLQVPYHSQRDNAYSPDGSCNVTSLAMCLSYLGIKGDGNGQLEDQLYRYCEAKGWDRHDPGALVKLAAWKGIKDSFTASGSLKDVEAAIDKGQPCIVHGYFTGSGHIIVICGYDTGKSKFICHDPYGEWWTTGYDRNDAQNSRKGAFIEYSYSMIQRLCSPEGGSSLWLHRLSK